MTNVHSEYEKFHHICNDLFYQFVLLVNISKVIEEDVEEQNFDSVRAINRVGALINSSEHIAQKIKYAAMDLVKAAMDDGDEDALVYIKNHPILNEIYHNL